MEQPYYSIYNLISRHIQNKNSTCSYMEPCSYLCRGVWTYVYGRDRGSTWCALFGTTSLFPCAIITEVVTELVVVINIMSKPLPSNTKPV